MNQKMIEQLKSLDEYARSEVFPISLFWQVNNVELGNDVVLTNKLIVAPINAGLTLYYINEDFDSEHCYIEFPLSGQSTKQIIRFVEYSDEYQHFVDSGDTVAGKAFPVRMTERMRLDIAAEYTALTEHIHIDELVVTAGLLFVKCVDIEQACELQGINTFFWPSAYPSSNSTGSVKYKLIDGVWACRSLAIAKLRSSIKKEFSSLQKHRIECVKRALQTHYARSSPQGSCSGDLKFPQVKEIYKMVWNERIFSNRGAPGAEPISIKSFQQEWKIYGPRVKQFFGFN